MNSTSKKNPAQDQINALQRGDELLLRGSAYTDSPVKRTHHQDLLRSYAKDSPDPDQIRGREDPGDEYARSYQDTIYEMYQSSIEEDWRGDLNEPEELEEDDGEWSEPRLFWPEFRPVEKRACHLLFPIHQRGLKMDEISPMTTEQAEKFKSRLLGLYEKVSTISDKGVWLDTIHALVVFRDSHPILREAVLKYQAAKRAERDKLRNSNPENRKRKKEYDQERNADPGRKQKEAARQRERRFTLKDV
jgi:hypothetical protein